MVTVQHLVTINKKKKYIICRIKEAHNKVSKGITKVIEVAKVQISLMARGKKITMLIPVPLTLLLQVLLTILL